MNLKANKIKIKLLLPIAVLVCGLVLVTACNILNLPSVATTTTTSSGPGSTTPTDTEPTVPLLGELWVHFIDVGQGDAILIDLEDTEILIDGGDRSPGVIGYLSQYVDGPLEVIVSTHPHADHIGGLIAVLDAFPVNQIWHNGDTSDSKTYSDFMSGVNTEGAEVHIAGLHDIIIAGELKLYVHHPASLEGSTNNNSIVLHLAFGYIDFLFTGDAETEAEGNMLVLSSVCLPETEILKVGHHGSRTSSSADFLSITSPEVAIYMAGADNRYGHPHDETIAALNAAGAKIYGTDVSGTIIVTTDGVTYSVVTERP
ncbi:ComEC/Rec2 family competence protein [Chloroflexota bacterium]